MGNRYWILLGVRLLVGMAIVAWAVSYIGGGSAEKEFQKTLEAMKQLHTFRATYVANTNGNHTEIMWEVDCDHTIVHHQSHFIEGDRDPPVEINEDDLLVGNRQFARQNDGSWRDSRNGAGNQAVFLCRHLADGADSYVLPQISTMIKRGLLQEGDKKTVNGARCREWLVTMKNGTAYLEHDKVCIGLDDHLPYEMSTEGNVSRYSFSDYNTQMQIDLPEGIVQPASASQGTN